MFRLLKIEGKLDTWKMKSLPSLQRVLFHSTGYIGKPIKANQIPCCGLLSVDKNAGDNYMKQTMIQDL